jgi:hypothetical protein
MFLGRSKNEMNIKFPIGAFPISKKTLFKCRVYPVDHIGWGWRIRTSPHGFRVRCPTARLTPNSFEIIALLESPRQQIPGDQ